jgi:nucleoside-diphosphate-sugar epimerase
MIDALLLAAEHGRCLSLDDPAQGVYLIALDEQPTYLEISNLAGRLVGRSNVRTFALPRWFCWCWGGVIDTWVMLTRHPRLLTVDKMRDAQGGAWTCATDKARQELGFTCKVGLEEGFTRLVAWYREHGWL